MNKKQTKKLKNRNKWRNKMLYSLVTEGLEWGVGGSLVALQNVSVYLAISQKNSETMVRYYVDLAVEQNNWTFSRVRGSICPFSAERYVFCLFVCLFYGSICLFWFFVCFLSLVLRKWHRPFYFKDPFLHIWKKKYIRGFMDCVYKMPHSKPGGDFCVSVHSFGSCKTEQGICVAFL